jgi:hypothetical protein
LQLIPPPQSILRNKSPRASSLISKPIKYSKTIHENTSKHISKSSHALPTPIWSPVLFEKEISPVRPFRSKSLFSKRTNTHNLSSNEKKSFTPDLFITPRMINIDDEIFKKVTVKDLVDECKFSPKKKTKQFCSFRLSQGKIQSLMLPFHPMKMIHHLSPIVVILYKINLPLQYLFPINLHHDVHIILIYHRSSKIQLMKLINFKFFLLISLTAKKWRS